MSEHIPSLNGETTPLGEGSRLYESKQYPNEIIRARSLRELVDVPLSNDATLNEYLRPSAPGQISPSERVELAHKLLGVQDNELELLEDKYGVNVVPFERWIGEADGQESVIYAASKMPGESMDKAIEEGSRWIDFDRFTEEVWRNYGQAMSGLAKYYGDLVGQEKSFLYDLAKPKQWVCDKETGSVILTDIDPFISYHVPGIRNVDMEMELEALYDTAKELAREGYMPRNDVTRLKWTLEDLSKRS